ncbi:hypothetical protein [Alloactinosynnema sp. L-07]|uniref:hypothetical protein n=1 Tax=Alloactinosynnema sp. L-07 TaxID=1653480 RepID=UPI00065F049E|nr:hypothetical protein [Alloactinosynnema sp. L-07]CRK59103.1 hypothetical protein [Alloactinosynnema sp. L-07]
MTALDRLADLAWHAPIISAYLRHRRRVQVHRWVCAMRAANPPTPVERPQARPLIDPRVDLIVQARPTAADMPPVGADVCPASAPIGTHHPALESP